MYCVSCSPDHGIALPVSRYFLAGRDTPDPPAGGFPLAGRTGPDPLPVTERGCAPSEERLGRAPLESLGSWLLLF